MQDKFARNAVASKSKRCSWAWSWRAEAVRPDRGSRGGRRGSVARGAHFQGFLIHVAWPLWVTGFLTRAPKARALGQRNRYRGLAFPSLAPKPRASLRCLLLARSWSLLPAHSWGVRTGLPPPYRKRHRVGGPGLQQEWPFLKTYLMT